MLTLLFGECCTDFSLTSKKKAENRKKKEVQIMRDAAAEIQQRSFLKRMRMRLRMRRVK